MVGCALFMLIVMRQRDWNNGARMINGLRAVLNSIMVIMTRGDSLQATFNNSFYVSESHLHTLLWAACLLVLVQRIYRASGWSKTDFIIPSPVGKAAFMVGPDNNVMKVGFLQWAMEWSKYRSTASTLLDAYNWRLHLMQRIHQVVWLFVPRVISTTQR